MQLLPALLLFGLPGYCFIRGPRTVTGGKQEPTIVRCHYSSGLETYNKWWCQGRIWTFCHVLVQTNGTEQEMTRDRVSIRDNQKDRVFTVTMKGLRRDDAGAYWCGIEKLGVDHAAQVKVNVDPAGSSNTATSSNSPARPSNTGMSLGSQRWTHYVLLVFVKVPILLILVSVVLWLRGSRRVPEEQWILVAPGNAPFPRSANDMGP